MFLIDNLILIVAVLLMLGIASSKFAYRFGVPVLVLFLILGMLAGSEGIGGIEFNDYELAHAMGTLALALILFDGGLSTPAASIQRAWKPAVVLSTWGVFLTSLVTGFMAAWMLGIPLLMGMLLGAIVGSTDAAAVFAILRSGGVRLPSHLSATLEMESGSNDPMAIFLTIALIEILTGEIGTWYGLLGLLLSQMVVGTVVGIGIGLGTVQLVNRINLDAAGLYPVLVSACGLLTYGLAASLGGSGFLAVYLAGIVIGTRRIVFQRGIFLFHDAAAWFGQILMFVMLGLLVFPRQVVNVAVPGLLTAAALIFLARPLAVVLSLLAFRFSWRELTFLSWVGLKGAVPITLATFPFMFDLQGAELLFNIVFFVVLISALVQGWSLPLVARKLGLQLPPEPEPPVTLELSSLRHVEGDIVDFTISEHSRAAGRLVRDLAMPEGAVIAIIARHDQIIPPQGNTRILPGDHVILVLRPGSRPLLSKIFGRKGPEVEEEEIPQLVEFPLRASTRVEQLEAFYGFALDAPPEATLDQAIRERLRDRPLQPGLLTTFGRFGFYVRELSNHGTIEQVGMVILPEPEEGEEPSEPPAVEVVRDPAPPS